MNEANQKDAANGILATNVKTEHAHVGGILATNVKTHAHVKTEATRVLGTFERTNGGIPDDVTTVMPVSILNASWIALSKPSGPMRTDTYEIMDTRPERSVGSVKIVDGHYVYEPASETYGVVRPQ